MKQILPLFLLILTGCEFKNHKARYDQCLARQLFTDCLKTIPVNHTYLEIEQCRVSAFSLSEKPITQIKPECVDRP